MSKTIFKKTDHQYIPNKQLEQMFLSIADDEMMKEYIKLVEKGLTGTATAYASHKVFKVFMYFRDNFIKLNGDMGYLTYMLFRRDK